MHQKDDPSKDSEAVQWPHASRWYATTVRRLRNVELCCETLQPKTKCTFSNNISFSLPRPPDLVYLSHFSLWSGLNFRIYLRVAAHSPRLRASALRVLLNQQIAMHLNDQCKGKQRQALQRWLPMSPGSKVAWQLVDLWNWTWYNVKCWTAPQCS